MLFKITYLFWGILNNRGVLQCMSALFILAFIPLELFKSPLKSLRREYKEYTLSPHALPAIDGRCGAV